MTIAEIANIIEAEVIGQDLPETVVLRACACDRLSDVLRCVTDEKFMLLTTLTHVQTVRVAEIVDAAAVCFMCGRIPGDEVISLAREKGIVLLATKLSTYEASGKLYHRGLCGCRHA